MGETAFSQWDFYNFRVQQELTGGQFVSAESTLVAAGPPSLEAAGGNGSEVVYPIGLLESVGIQQSRQLQRIFEIGSSRSYFIPGRTVGSLSIGRTFYFGPSLLRVLYAYYRTAGKIGNMGTLPPGTTKDTDSGTTVLSPQAALLGAKELGSLPPFKRNPGFGYLLMDLASDLFSQPTGLAIYFKDANTDTLGGFYLEEAYVQGHQMTISSGSVIVMEGVSMQYDRIVPLDISVF
ncbi:MAG: hypothetical protein MUP21_00150 [Dehalococcoidia bacterium]|nr:hypothetical protein [Dehalococcoidia bacterium]